MVFGEESVTGIDGVRLREQDGRKDDGNVRVVPRIADVDDLVGELVPRLSAVRVRHDGDRKAGLLDKPPRGAQRGQALQQRLIADGDQMPGLPVPRARR